MKDDKSSGSRQGNKEKERTILLDFLVKPLLLVGVLKIVLLSRASFGADTDSDNLGLRALSQRAQTINRRRCLLLWQVYPVLLLFDIE